MPEARDLAALADIVACIDRITVYVSGMDEAAFRASPMQIDAVAMNLLVIGEAVRGMSPATLAVESSIPWPRVIAVRNRIAHGYSSLQLDVVWTIITRELPLLRAAVLRLAGEEGRNG